MFVDEKEGVSVVQITPQHSIAGPAGLAATTPQGGITSTAVQHIAQKTLASAEDLDKIRRMAPDGIGPITPERVHALRNLPPKMTQAEVAAVCLKSPNTVAAWEMRTRNGRNCPASSWRDLCRHRGVPTTWGLEYARRDGASAS
jgi:DNA-binding transcriptional regulator YiaG